MDNGLISTSLNNFLSFFFPAPPPRDNPNRAGKDGTYGPKHVGRKLECLAEDLVVVEAIPLEPFPERGGFCRAAR